MGERNKRVFALLDKQGKTRAAMARALDISKSAVSQWERKGTEPTYEQCALLAPFFDVTLEYLLNGTDRKGWEPTITEKDDRDIKRQLEKTLNQLESETGLMFDGNYLDDEAREKLKNSLELVMEGTRLAAKEKFTPDKYKK